MSFTFLTWSVV